MLAGRVEIVVTTPDGDKAVLERANAGSTLGDTAMLSVVPRAERSHSPSRPTKSRSMPTASADAPILRELNDESRDVSDGHPRILVVSPPVLPCRHAVEKQDPHSGRAVQVRHANSAVVAVARAVLRGCAG